MKFIFAIVLMSLILTACSDPLEKWERCGRYNGYCDETRACLAVIAQKHCGEGDLYGVWQEIMTNRTPQKTASYICQYPENRLELGEFNETELQKCGWT